MALSGASRQKQIPSSYTGSGFTSVVSTGLASGFTASFDASTGIVTVIPEPSAALLGCLGVLALLRRRRA